MSFDLTNPAQIKNLLIKYNLLAQKKLGQNFLINKKVLGKIVKAGEVGDQDEVLEIGPGIGVLTTELAKHANHVTSIELDSKLLPLLKSTTYDFKNIEILNEDALKFKIKNSKFKIISNIPYYITSPLINHFLKDEIVEKSSLGVEPNVPELIVLLVQKEVAEKICMKGEFKSKHSVLSLNVQIFAEAEIVDFVSKTSFYPQPKVTSAILKIRPHPKLNLHEKIIQNLPSFFKTIQAGFSNPRKQIHNCLSNGLHLSSEKTIQILSQANIDAKRRAETLEIKEWEKLFLNLL
ncbi:MAG: hypothetical protein UR28_C0027G0005 [Candidatus Peregrinibacteria bacterium GW2011_GWF2_33_10]|nr:MAG: hypothetical protein UR28_C0027G0005 [Candidatus Peregrinibacteria bacterium GW2011_GWF2_33_10]OGJ44856.1 MAG: ribosomal RNA small subunit methyltransferase A [Candidatus Peregrinibacteria bacterium RIFOXYA2_FULL_33_21]OGJ47141.1 MAG: ribosomal RNA small subunit methyltransferase A [Candidatus Peregrinibacteria bacterium RIFOXYA12_FULL_33_12]OGJ50542.1 MAG: ribosomal RNA small subunit methyltransferase A [Candidatus Peregrinibacteria bacterium RIFOXYB2_FULL_33_20]